MDLPARNVNFLFRVILGYAMRGYGICLKCPVFPVLTVCTVSQFIN